MRLFVGVALPGGVKDSLARFIEDARGVVPDAKWVPRDNLHVTVAFLGEVDDARVPRILDALAVSAADLKGPIETAVRGSGAFPSPRRARVLWAGLDDPEQRLAGLADAVSTTLEPLGFPKETRAWSAHVTVARFRAPRDASSMLAAAPEPVGFVVPSVTLFRSRLARPAPRYEIVGERELGGA